MPMKFKKKVKKKEERRRGKEKRPQPDDPDGTTPGGSDDPGNSRHGHIIRRSVPDGPSDRHRTHPAPLWQLLGATPQDA